MKRLFLTVICVLTMTSSFAQTMPKWVAKASKAVFSVITYSADNKILNTGNGFYIDEDGTAVSDYTLFKDAHHAVIVTSDGKEVAVESILGANYLYDVIKFKTAPQKKLVFLKSKAEGATIDAPVYLLPYSTQKAKTIESGKVLAADSISQKALYYTLDIPSSDKMISCPIMSAEGEVVGLLQKNSGEDKEKSYAIGIEFAHKLSITALSGQDNALRAIGIKKALPDDEDQAQVYLFMNAGKVEGKVYLELLDDYIAKFPNSVEGYSRRAAYYASENTSAANELAQKDMDMMIKMVNDKDVPHYQIAQLMYSYALQPEDKRSNPEWTLQSALDEVNQAIKIKAEGLYYQTKADILFAMKDYKQALEAYKEVNKTALSSAASFYSAAKTLELIEGSDKKEVIALMDSAITKFKNIKSKESAPYFLERARLLTEVRDFRHAVLDYNSAYDALMGNVSSEFYFLRHNAELEAKMYPQAIDDINKAVEITPSDIELWLVKAGTHIRVNQLDEAKQAIEKVLTLDANNAAAYRMLGFIQVQQKNAREGIKNLEKAKTLGDPVVDKLLEKYKK